MSFLDCRDAVETITGFETGCRDADAAKKESSVDRGHGEETSSDDTTGFPNKNDF